MGEWRILGLEVTGLDHYRAGLADG